VLQAFCVAGYVVTVLATCLRIYVRLSKQRRLYSDDYALLVAVGFYWALVSLYIVDLPYLYAFYAFLAGKSSTQADVADQYRHMMMISFVVTALLWAVLWSVKISLLLFFRRVIQGTTWIRAWWIILGVVVTTFVGFIVSELLSCDTIADFTVLGACVSAKNQRAQIISLYYSFTADVVTEAAGK
jgi:hypothetical protein